MSAAKPRRWLEKIDDLYEAEVHQKAKGHARTNYKAGHLNPLGYPWNNVERHILEMGRARFKDGYSHPNYGDIDKFEKTLLYCYFNLRGHFHSSAWLFEDNKNFLLKQLFVGTPYVIDIGCGPATSALALAVVFPNKPIRYLGVDSAQAMRNRGTSLLNAARANGILHKDTTFSFYSSKLPPLPKNYRAMFNFAFFFASATLNDEALESLAAGVRAKTNSREGKKAVFSYTNSTFEGANDNYQKFQDILKLWPNDAHKESSVTYVNSLKRGGSATPLHRLFCDDPLSNLLTDLLIGVYGYPYHPNVQKQLRIEYTAKNADVLRPVRPRPVRLLVRPRCGVAALWDGSAAKPANGATDLHGWHSQARILYRPRFV